jgi:hypothetical protein
MVGGAVEKQQPRRDCGPHSLNHDIKSAVAEAGVPEEA